MAIDTKKWLIENLGFSEAEAEAAAPTFAAKADRVEAYDNTVRHAAAERGQIATERAALQAANDDLNRQIAEWGQVTSAGATVTQQMQTDLENARAEVARLTSRLTTVAQQAGIDPATVVPAAPAAAAPAVAAAVDLTGYARTDAINQQVGNVASWLLDLQPELDMIGHEHQQLTGEFLDKRPITAELKKRATDPKNTKSTNPRDIWNELHNIDAKRTAREAELRTADMTAAELRGYERARTEQSIPGVHAPGSHSPVFTHPSATGSKLQRPTAPVRVSAAAAALATHRYRPKVGAA